MEVLHALGPLPSAFTLGTASHLLILKNFELDVWIPHFIGASLVSFVALASYHVSVASLPLSASLSQTALEATCFTAGILTSMTIYRAFFHRIRHFPGPFLAGVTRFYALYLSSKKVQYHVELDKLHKKYGDFVRTGPREIAIFRKSAIPLTIGPTAGLLKTTWYSQGALSSSKTQLFFSRDPVDHKRRRRAWDQGFSVKSLATYQPRIKDCVDQLTTQLGNSGGKAMDATAWTMMLAFDVMGEVAFGKDFGGLRTGKEPAAARAVHDHMTVLGTLGMVPWLLWLLQFIPGATQGYAPFIKWCAEQVQGQKKKYVPDEKTPRNLSGWLIKAFVEGDASAPPTEDALNDDARLMIIAGSDTSATANACTLYYLAKHPHILRKLQQKLDEAMPRGEQDWSYEKVLSVTYVDDIIRESLRLKPPVITGGYRVTPPEGLQVDEVYIPGDVNVFTPFELMHTDERYWPQAHEFVPERWGERRKEMGTDDTLFIPFSSGAYKCPGDKLAMMSMRTAIACIAQQFDIEFAPGETAKVFLAERKDAFTTVLPPLQLCFKPRKKSGI